MLPLTRSYFVFSFPSRSDTLIVSVRFAVYLIYTGGYTSIHTSSIHPSYFSSLSLLSPLSPVPMPSREPTSNYELRIANYKLRNTNYILISTEHPIYPVIHSTHLSTPSSLRLPINYISIPPSPFPSPSIHPPAPPAKPNKETLSFQHNAMNTKYKSNLSRACA